MLASLLERVVSVASPMAADSDDLRASFRSAIEFSSWIGSG